MDLHARRFDTGEPVKMSLDNGRIAAMEPFTGPGTADSLPWVAPGLIDLQVNGYGGQEFSSETLTVEHVAQIAAAMENFGVTRFCPTVTTQSFACMAHALDTLRRACEQTPDLARQIPGFHVEGPYITTEDGARGAHPLTHVRPPDFDEFQRFQEAAGGRIRIVTMSPEFDGATDFIRRACATGVVVSIGHTAATPEQIAAAVDAGLSMATHLGNGSHATLHRHRNYLWPQLADDRITAGMICDGFHLPPSMVKVFVRAMGIDRCVLVSDLSGLAGLPPGRYRTGLCELEILDSGKLVVAGQREALAGAGLPIGVGIVNVMQYAGVTLSEAVSMATTNPARVLRMPPPRLEVGGLADLVIFELSEGFRVRDTLVSGE
ncbi:MAG: amidohydrolase family protein [Patescibacteria group bacterium]|nr:amidohydrolase family protein [Patescibacteria group bacterium]